ncbi:BTB (POZ) domain containing 6 [Mactra antiquata]
MEAEKQPDWRSKIGVAESVEHLYNEKVMSDITFIFTDKEPLKAHKVILGMRSAVFEAMFYGAMSEKNNEVHITDINRDIFDMMLKYIYTNSIEVNGESVLKCLNAGKKYCIDGLIQVCEDFLENSISVNNVCSIFEQAKFFELKYLVSKCENFIANNAVKVAKSDDFTNLLKESLKGFLAYPKIESAEIEYFKAANRWAENKCKQRNIDPTPTNKRSELGETLNEIKFALMDQEEFAKVVAPTHLLTGDEQAQLYSWIILKRWPSEEIRNAFPSIPRGTTENCVAITKNDGTGDITMEDKIVINLLASHHIQVISIGMPLEVGIESVQLLVKREENTEHCDDKQVDITSDVQTYGKTIQLQNLFLEPQNAYTLTFQLKKKKAKKQYNAFYGRYENIDISLTYNHYKRSDVRYMWGGVYIQLPDIAPSLLKSITYKCKTRK